MKKFFYAIMVAIIPVVAMSLASCSDDNDLPNVNISLDVQNAQVVDNTIYVLQGDTLNVEGLQVTNNEAGKAAAVTNVRYYINGFFIGQSFTAPFPAYNLTDVNTKPGRFDLGVTCTVLAPDKSIATAALNYPVVVVESVDDIPGDAVATTVQRTVNLK